MPQTQLKSQQAFGGDGWQIADETWTYASATTITISGDVTAKYQVGDLIKFTQTTVKYFIVSAISYSSPNTTITLAGIGTATVANATITLPYYCHQNPTGITQVKSIARFYNGSTQVIAGNNSVYEVNMDTVNFDTNNELNTTTHRFTAKKTGYYLVSFNAMFQSGGFRVVAQILINGARYGESAAESLAQYSTLNVTNIVPMTKGEYLSFGVMQNSGANKTFHSDYSAAYVSITEL